VNVFLIFWILSNVCRKVQITWHAVAINLLAVHSNVLIIYDPVYERKQNHYHMTAWLAMTDGKISLDQLARIRLRRQMIKRNSEWIFLVTINGP